MTLKTPSQYVVLLIHTSRNSTIEYTTSLSLSFLFSFFLLLYLLSPMSGALVLSTGQHLERVVVVVSAVSANAACRCRPRFSLAAQGVHISNIYMIGRCKASHLSLFRNFCIFFFVLSGLPYAVFPSGGRCVRTRVLAAAETTRFLPVAEHLQKTMSMLKCEYQ